MELTAEKRLRRDDRGELDLWLNRISIIEKRKEVDDYVVNM